MIMPISSRRQIPEQHLQPWGTLLQMSYARAGLSMPRLEKLEPEDMPQPYRRLLVHSMDLTPTLEAYYQQRLGLTVLSRWREDASYLREVVLRLAGSGKRVGYGVIRVALEHLPPASANRVLQEQAPFGGILQADGIPHLSWPQAFFSAEPDEHMLQVLGMKQPCLLYGRRNVLLDGSRRLLAEVVEVLAAVAAPDREGGRRRRAVSPGRNGALKKKYNELV